MKRLRPILLLLTLCALLAALTVCAGAVTLYVDEDGSAVYHTREITPVAIICGGEVLESDIPAYVTEGRTMVPVRLISETLGADVEWLGQTNQVRITLSSREILLTIGSATALVDGSAVALYNGIPAVVASNGAISRTMVPLRFVVEQLGAMAEWDSVNQAAVITPSAAEQSTVTALTVEDGVFRIAYEGTCVPSVFTLTGPNRLVVDLPGGVLTDAIARRYEIGGGLVAAVRTNQYNRGYDGYVDVARIVFDLADGSSLSDLTATAASGVVLVHASSFTPELPDEPVEPENPDEPADPDAPTDPENPEEPDAPTDPENPEEPDAPTDPEAPTPDTQQPTPRRPVVVLDAGHGGTDPGTQAPGLDEKDIDLEVTLLAGAILEQAGVEVRYTRKTDDYVLLADRVKLANELPADIFVSIHANASSTSTEFHGVETYYLASKPESRPLAAALHASVLEATGANDHSVRTGDYFLLREAKMPAALVEMGYVTNPAELAQLLKPEYRQAIAAGIAAGVISYLTANGLL